jgi:2-dehydropantoate 2-reductase
MKILVYGAGAVGSTFGGFLSRDHEVTLLGRRRHLQAIRRRGLEVTGIWGRHRFRRFVLETDVRNLIRSRKAFDWILVTVKSYDTLQAARALRRLAAPSSVIVLLQNGLGNIEIFHRYFPRRQVLAGRVIFGAVVSAPGRVKITVMAHPTAVGETAQRKVTPRVRRMVRGFAKAGLPSVACADVQALLWAKVIYNCALNPLASLLACHYGLLGESGQTRAVMDRVIEEIYQVARKAGVRLAPPSPAAYRKVFYSTLVPRTYHHHPSMLQDLRYGRRTEIDALNGAIVRLGRRYQVRTPANRYLTYLVKKKESLKKAS